MTSLVVSGRPHVRPNKDSNLPTFHDRIQDHQKFAHACHKGHFSRLACFSQPLIILAYDRIKSQPCNHRHVQHRTQVRSTTPDPTFSPHLPAVVVEWCYTD